MKFEDYAMQTAHECGAYKAIAGMMRDNIRQIEAAEAGSFEADWAMKSLVMLAQQLEDFEENLKKEVDSVAV